MPARHRHSPRRELRIKNKNKVELKKYFAPLKKVFVLLLVLLAIAAFFITRTKYWDGEHKLAVVVSKADGDVEIDILDPSNDSISTINVPDSTEVEVARQLGRWRIKNVVKLGEKDGSGGSLLAQTITKHLKFPVYLWADQEFTGFVSGDFGKSLGALFGKYKTNLEMGDRLRIFFFSLNVKNYKRESVDLADTTYLKPAVLSDGAGGYVITGVVPTSILAGFAEADLSESVLRAKIVDKGSRRIGEEIGKILEVAGLKVVSVNEEEGSDMDCEVSGKSSRAILLATRLFSCQGNVTPDSGYDLIITFGGEFEKRF